MPEEKELIFECRKCQHQIYTMDARKLIGRNCPTCGEEWQENWFLVGEGRFEDHKGPKVDK